MRPFRFIIILGTCILAFFLLLFLGPFRASTQEDLAEPRSLRTYFNWRTPSSLFPPSAIISLTDDNSTFFLARPAAFGPVLPAKSLSGQLWVGSGFADDHLRAGAGSVEGELGCSDIPDWDSGKYFGTAGSNKGFIVGKARSSEQGGKKKRSIIQEMDADEQDGDEELEGDDGTDDHLHHPLPPSDGLKTNGAPAGKKPSHADIQSLQEGAEIAGKVVLLSRGGCGFLEKVKWVQRRGGVALIVGDDIRGGPLVTMYARGDTSNVTIPSLFTSHTTAHLLSSLIPSGGALDDLSAEQAARLGLALGERTGQQKSNPDEKPNFTTTSVAVKATSTPELRKQESVGKVSKAHSDNEADATDQDLGWLWSFFSGSRRGRHGDSRRPPSSGNIGWVLQEDFEDDEIFEDGIAGKQTSSTVSSAPAPTRSSSRGSEDGFVIGVQDWRDPDLVAEAKEKHQAMTASSSSTASSTTMQRTTTPKHGPKGGRIVPGSGEYGKAVHEAIDIGGPSTYELTKERAAHEKPAKEGTWLSRLFGSDHEQHAEEDSAAKQSAAKALDDESPPPKKQPQHRPHQAHADELHDGLWVTLTPTSMSSSPFFDTLLVLVVSPLVTLTVVYALLLLRSRIRRRRWRAPKSVVERLPVRTYQTMPSTTTTSSTASAVSTPAVSAATPLLPSSARPISTRSRPRARTASEVPASSSSLRSDGMASPSLEEIEEKRAAGLAERRRRYGGKQRECVVCLEEYVDGVSRVMSLPCGHEFHEGCM